MMENEVLIKMRINKLHYGRQNTCRILSTIFIEKDITQIDADFCQDNTAWIQIDFINIRDGIQLKDWTMTMNKYGCRNIFRIGQSSI